MKKTFGKGGLSASALGNPWSPKMEHGLVSRMITLFVNEVCINDSIFVSFRCTGWVISCRPESSHFLGNLGNVGKYTKIHVVRCMSFQGQDFFYNQERSVAAVIFIGHHMTVLL